MIQTEINCHNTKNLCKHTLSLIDTYLERNYNNVDIFILMRFEGEKPVRDSEYFGYNSDDTHNDAYNIEHNADTHTNEMARNAVERFLEAETSDYISGYDSRRAERPDRTERSPGFTGHHMEEHVDDAWCPPAPPDFSDDDEFMAQLANIRRERPRREMNPTPKPAVRVNTERRRRTPSPELHETDMDWAPLEDKDVDAFRMRYSEDDIMSPPKEAMMKDSQPKGVVPAHRRDPDRPVSGGEPSPLRYLLAIVFVGVLFLMAFLAINNRNLRRDLDANQSQIARIEDNAEELERLRLEVSSLNATLTQYRAQANEQQNEQPQAPDYPPDVEYAYPPDYEAPYRPTDETPPYDPQPTPPPQPEQVIHIVQPGEFLSHIARIHFNSHAQHYIDLIVAANDDIANANNIRVGQAIIIPPRE